MRGEYNRYIGNNITLFFLNDKKPWRAQSEREIEKKGKTKKKFVKKYFFHLEFKRRRKKRKQNICFTTREN